MRLRCPVGRGRKALQHSWNILVVWRSWVDLDGLGSALPALLKQHRGAVAAVTEARHHVHTEGASPGQSSLDTAQQNLRSTGKLKAYDACRLIDNLIVKVLILYVCPMQFAAVASRPARRGLGPDSVPTSFTNRSRAIETARANSIAKRKTVCLFADGISQFVTTCCHSSPALWSTCSVTMVG